MSAEYLFPGSILALKFVTKLLSGRRPDFGSFVEAACALPTDMVFLSITLLASAAIVPNPEVSKISHLIPPVFFIFLIFAFVITGLTNWNGEKLKTLNTGIIEYLKLCLSLVICFSISTFMISLSIQALKQGVP